MHSNYSWSTQLPKQNNEEACLGNFSGGKVLEEIWLKAMGFSSFSSTHFT